MTLEELKQYLLPLAHTGELTIEITDSEDGGKQIKAIDKDINEVEIDGEKRLLDSSTTIGCFYTSTHNVDGVQRIGFIEHNYNAITVANHKDIIHLCNLINTPIEFN